MNYTKSDEHLPAGIVTGIEAQLIDKMCDLSLEIRELRRAVRAICLGIVGMAILMVVLTIWGAFK